VTYAPRLQRSESRIDWARPAAAVHDQIRGLQPWPLAAAVLAGRRVMFHRSRVVSDIMEAGEPGTISAIEADGFVVATRPGALRILEIQAEGRQPLRAPEFVRGSRLTAGLRFDPLPVT
jgi:methionyl-tRNA formyltransferase